MRSFLAFALIAFLFSGCAGQKYRMAPEGSLPPDRPEWEIETSSSFEDLSRNYGKGAAYEHAKIRYLLAQIATADYVFIRNGEENGGEITSRHLRRKYRQRIKAIKTASDFIEKAGSRSEMSGKPYQVLAGDGLTYLSRDMLYCALHHLEAEMDRLMAVEGRMGRTG